MRDGRPAGAGGVLAGAEHRLAAPATLALNDRHRSHPIIAAAAVLSPVLWFIEIERAFDLPAYPLLIDVPLVFIPLLGLAAIAVAATDRYATPVAIFAVVTLSFTLLAAGAGEAFLESCDAQLRADPTMQDHADAGDRLRFTVSALMFALVGLPSAKLPAPRLVPRVLIVLLALVALLYTIRTGHLGAELGGGLTRIVDKVNETIDTVKGSMITPPTSPPFASSTASTPRSWA